MSRIKNARRIISYLEERINCKNVMKFVDETMNKVLNKDKEMKITHLNIDGISTAFKMMNYNDLDNYVRKNENDPKDKTWVKNIYDIFDFMTEANYTGFEYFPYLYGVLDCHNGENSKIYIFYETFDDNLIDLINKIEHSSEWYDIVFQIIMINYYILIVNEYRYDNATLQKHFYKKLEKPYYKEYELDGNKLIINHKYLIVLWDFNHMEKMTEDNKNVIITNIDYLLKYLSDNKDKIKIPPSSRIIKLLHEIKNNPKNTPTILFQYYDNEQKK